MSSNETTMVFVSWRLMGHHDLKRVCEMDAELFRAQVMVLAFNHPGSAGWNRFFFDQSPNGKQRAPHPGHYAKVTTRRARILGSRPTCVRSQTHTIVRGHHCGVVVGSEMSKMIAAASAMCSCQGHPPPRGFLGFLSLAVFRAHPSSDSGKDGAKISGANETRWLHDDGRGKAGRRDGTCTHLLSFRRFSSLA